MCADARDSKNDRINILRDNSKCLLLPFVSCYFLLSKHCSVWWPHKSCSCTNAASAPATLEWRWVPRKLRLWGQNRAWRLSSNSAGKTQWAARRRRKTLRKIKSPNCYVNWPRTMKNPNYWPPTKMGTEQASTTALTFSGVPFTREPRTTQASRLMSSVTFTSPNRLKIRGKIPYRRQMAFWRLLPITMFFSLLKQRNQMKSKSQEEVVIWRTWPPPNTVEGRQCKCPGHVGATPPPPENSKIIFNW